MKKKVKRTERGEGFGGHFIMENDCGFRRFTVLEYQGLVILVSTIGSIIDNGKLYLFNGDRYFESKAFYPKEVHLKTGLYLADPSSQVYFRNIKKEFCNDPNLNHENLVSEIENKIKERRFF